MIRGIISCVLVLSSLIVMAAGGNTYEDYYQQRKTLFEKLPINSSDVVFLGNSLTNGGNWNELFQSQSMKNRGIISDIIQGVYDRVDLVTKGHPKKIFLLIGVNDISHKFTAQQIVDGIEGLVKKIKHDTPTTELYLQSLLPINNDFKRYRNLIGTEAVFPKANILLEKMAKRQNIKWINIFPAFADSEGKMNKTLTVDGLHLNSDGYKIWRDQLAKYVYDDNRQLPAQVYEITSKDDVIVGNSLVSGCEWNELLQADVKKRNTGETVSSISKSLDKILEGKPNRIFLTSAYDNLSGNINGDSIVKSMERAILKIKKLSPSTRIYLQSLVPVKSSYKNYSGFTHKIMAVELVNNRLRTMAKKNGAKWIDLYPALADDSGELKSEFTNDGYHLNGDGYVAWKSILQKYFSPAK